MDISTVTTTAGNVGNTTTDVLDKIPALIGMIRDIVTKFLPSGYYALIIAILAIVAAYFWMKQFVSSGFLKLSILINIILLALLIFLVFVYI